VSNRTLPRLGAACGILFPIGLFLGAGHYALWGLALVAIVLFMPFLAYLCGLIRTAEGEQGWLASAAYAAGLAGITLKLGSIAPEIAIRRAHIADGTSLHAGLQGIADAATDVCLYPLGFMLAAIAVAAIRTHVLPRWLGYGAGLTAVALVVNGSYNLYVSSGFIPAFLLYLLWTLCAGIVLMRTAQPERSRATRPAQAAA
jgi:ABC-type multidrug transport system permease subunit